MDALRFNKIAAALLSGVLLIMVFGKIGNLLVSPNTEISNAYPIEVPEKAETKIKETKEIFQLHYPNFKNKTLVQKDLANTLKIIASKGRKGFYEGEIAEKISSEIKKNNGLISKSDLKNYSPVFHFHTFYTNDKKF